MKHVTLLAGLLTYSLSLLGQTTHLAGKVQSLNATRLTCTLMSPDPIATPRTILLFLNRGRFDHHLTIREPTFVNISDGANAVGGFVEPGDQLVVEYDSAAFAGTLRIRGKGHQKIALAQAINQLRSLARAEVVPAKLNAYPIDFLYAKIDSLASAINRQLVTNKSQMSKVSYHQIEGHLKAMVLREKYNGAVTVFGDSLEGILTNHAHRLSPASRKALSEWWQFDDSLSDSPFYVKLVANKLEMYYNDRVQSQSAGSLTKKYAHLSDRLPTRLRSSVLFLLLSSDITSHNGPTIDTIIARYFTASKESKLRRLISQQLTKARCLKVGTPAPDFVLEDSAGRTITLASLRGKVVHLDFWFAGCAPCHQLFNQIKPVKVYFQADTNVVFLVVSVDDYQTWQQALTRFNIQGQHVFTQNKFRVHPIVKAYQVQGYPSTFLISPSGTFYTLTPAHDLMCSNSRLQTRLQALPNS